jgi:hypothetical protein
MRIMLRLHMVLWALGVMAITSVVALSRLRNPGPISHWLLYTTQSSGGVMNIYRVRPVPSAPQRLGTPLVEVLSPCWSPDGQWIAFFASGKVEAGRIYPQYYQYALYRMRADGSHLEELASSAELRVTPINLRWSPDGQFLLWDLFVGEMVLAPGAASADSRALVAVAFRLRLASGEMEYRQQTRGMGDGEWRPVDDHMKFSLGANTAPIQTSLSSAAFSQPIAAGDQWVVIVRADADPPGIYRGPVQPHNSLDVERDGELLLALPSDQLTGMTSSPDGQVVMVASMGPGGGKVYRVDVPRGTVRQVVGDSSPYHMMDVAFSPDGRWVAITTHRTDSSSVRVLAADDDRLRSVENLPLLAGGVDEYRDLDWSPPESQTFRWWIPLAAGTGCLALGPGLRVRMHSRHRS